MREPKVIIDDIYEQLSRDGMARIDLGRGFFIEVIYAEPPVLEWPYDVFRDLAGKYLGYAAEVEVTGIALYAASHL